MNILNMYKVVVRDKNGKVLQIHELYKVHAERIALQEADAGHSVTITRLT